MPRAPSLQQIIDGERARSPIAQQRLTDSRIAKSISNRERAKDPAWRKKQQQGIRKWLQQPDTAEKLKQARLKSQQTKQDPNWKQQHGIKMRSVYASAEFKQACRKGCAAKDRSQRISEALSQKISTGDGVFTVSTAAKYYNLTPEGVRYRARINRDWKFIHRHNKKTISVSADKRKQMDLKRLEVIAKKQGYIKTPAGQYLSVRAAWRAQRHLDANTQANPFDWFRKMQKLYPNDYYRVREPRQKQ